MRSDVADTAGDHHRLPTPPARRRARQQRERQRGEPAHERMFVGVGGDLASAAPGTRGAMFAAARANYNAGARHRLTDSETVYVTKVEPNLS